MPQSWVLFGGRTDSIAKLVEDRELPLGAVDEAHEPLLLFSFLSGDSP